MSCLKMAYIGLPLGEVPKCERSLQILEFCQVGDVQCSPKANEVHQPAERKPDVQNERSEFCTSFRALRW